MEQGKSQKLELLIAAVAKGDRSAFDTLYLATADKLHAICLSVLKNRPAAEEALEQVYLTAWEGAKTYRPHHLKAMTWLVVLARNLAIDAQRQQNSQPRPVPALAIANSARPQPDLGQKEGSATPLPAELPPEEAEAMRAIWLEGLSYADLGNRLDLPVKPLRGWFRRSLAALPGDPPAANKLPPLTPTQEADALAAELAMDLLEDTEREAALDRMAKDADFAAKVRQWQEKLALLSTELTPVLAPTRTKVMIDRKLGHAQLPELQAEPRGPIPLTPVLLALVAAVALIGAAILFLSGRDDTTTSAAEQQALLVATEEGVRVRAEFDVGSAVLTIGLIDGRVPAGQDYQLWLMAADDEAPRPLAVVPRNGRLRVSLPTELIPEEGASLAMTQETEGGAVSGRPPGPIIATAPLLSQ